MDRSVCKRNRCKENKTVVNQPSKGLPFHSKKLWLTVFTDGRPNKQYKRDNTKQKCIRVNIFN